MVFMVLLPTMFVLAPWKQLVAILLLVIIFNLLAWEYKTPASYTADSWNSVFFGTVGVISGFYFDRVMLIALANELVRYFGHELSFRFGGDEFLAVALDESLPEVEKKCDQFLENLQKQGYQVSLGISQQRVDHKQLLFEADKAMRQAKAAYYQDTEHDRRAR
jgi:hypothetical protein